MVGSAPTIPSLSGVVRSHTRRGRSSGDQYESELITSPPLIEPSACQTPTWAPGLRTHTDWSRVTPTGFPVLGSSDQVWIESLMNRTEPSTKATLAPPGWKLDTPLTNAPAWSMRRFPTLFWGL